MDAEPSICSWFCILLKDAKKSTNEVYGTSYSVKICNVQKDFTEICADCDNRTMLNARTWLTTKEIDALLQTMAKWIPWLVHSPAQRLICADSDKQQPAKISWQSWWSPAWAVISTNCVNQQSAKLSSQLYSALMSLMNWLRPNKNQDTVSLTCAISFNIVYSPENNFCGLCQATLCRDELAPEPY